MIEPLVAAFVIGIMGAGHCLSMCGGITAALSFSISKDPTISKWQVLLGYNVGRIVSYSLVGALVGWFGEQLVSGLGLVFLRIGAGILLILMGFYVSGWWKILTKVERLGHVVWRRIKPIGDKVMPVRNFAQAFVLGGAWGWLPCGLVYSVLGLAAAQASGVGGALIMMGFGLGTLPAVLLGGFSASALKAWVQKQPVRQAMGVLLILFGIWTVYIAQLHAGHNHQEHNHQEHSHEENNHEGHHTGHEPPHMEPSDQMIRDDAHKHHDEI